MAPSNWLRSLRNTRERYSVRKTRPIRKATLQRKLLLELLEDRTLLAPVLGFDSTVAVAKGTAVIDTAVITSGGTLVPLYYGGGVADGSRLFNGGTWTDTTLGAAITLSASEGNIVQNSDGTWSWSENTPTGAGPVTITATDSQGSTSIQFWLKVNQVFTVKTASDNGDNANPLANSLRQAIVSVNNDNSNPAGAPEMIAFNIGTGQVTIALSSTALLPIGKRVLVDGFTQPGSSPNTLPAQGTGAGNNANWGITLDGSAIGSPVDGLAISAGDSAIQGLVIQNFGTDIHLTTNGNDQIAGNYLADGGLFIDNVANNIVGGTTAAARNVMSGVDIEGVAANNNVVEGNYIGTDGFQLIGSANPAILIGASNNLVGGTATGAGNVIASVGKGILISGEAGSIASGNLVQGNYIGLNAAGTAVLPVGRYGIALGGSSNTTIGGTTTSARNVISGWSDTEVEMNFGQPDSTGVLVEGNYIGTNADGSAYFAEADGGGIDSADTVNLVISDNLVEGFGQGGMNTGTQGGEVTGNTIAFNAGVGIVAQGGGAQIKGNAIHDNGGAAIEVNGTGLQIEGNSIYGNTNNKINRTTGPAIDNISQVDRDGPSFNVGTTFVDTNWPGGPFTGTNSASLSVTQTQTPTQTGSTLTYSGTLTGGLMNSRYLVGLAAQDLVGDNPGYYYTYLFTDGFGNATFTNLSFPAPAGFPSNQGSLPATYSFAHPPHSLGNYEQNFPVLTSVTSSATDTSISGTLNGQASTTFRVEFFANPTADRTGYGQGQTCLGYTNVTTDGTGNATFSADLPLGGLAGQWITATATDLPNAALGTLGGNTSEFSNDVPILAPGQTFAQFLQAALPQSSTQPNSLTIVAGPSTMPDAVIQAVNGLTNVTQPVTIILDLGGGTWSTGGVVANPPPNVTFVVQNGTLDPAYPALTVAGGQVSVLHCTLTTTGDVPTILVTGGSLTLRNDIIQESTGFTDAAISVTGGTVDLGTTAGSGNNTLNLNGTGQFVQNTTANAISAVGDTFESNGTVLTAPTLSFTSETTSSAMTIPGQAVTFTAKVTANGSGTPIGSVDFVDTTTNTDLGSVALSGGAASLTTSALALGTHVIRANYSGDSTFLLSLANVTKTVTKSIFVLNSSAGGALSISGNAAINIPGNLIVDSNSTKALTESGNAKITASSIQVVGGVSKSGDATLTPAATTGIAVVADPLAGLHGPSTTGMTNYGSVSLSGNKTQSINPGIYSSISASGNASLTLNPGIYIIEGGGFTVTGNASVSGTGVMIYNTGSNYPNNGGSFGGLTISGAGTVSLSAPTSGTYAGIVIFQPAANTRAISLSGNAASGLTGTVYAPAALLTLSGNATLQGAVVVNLLSLSGNASSTLSVDGSNGSSGAAGQLLAGNLLVYINDLNGLFTADELARIQDAVNAVDATVEPYAVSVTETTDSTAANVIVDTGSTSAAGGYADGVLGCYTSAGEITLIQGWNWYAGSDATQISTAQYDFETAVVHELGHALGLGHSGAGASVMYPTLTTGTADRVMTTGDLAIPDAAAGADALHAAGIATPVASSLPTMHVPERDAFFALLTNAAAQPALASSVLSQNPAHDPVFAESTGVLGAMLLPTKLAALNDMPIFGAASSLETDEAPFSCTPVSLDSVQEVWGNPLIPSAPPAGQPDALFDFIPAAGTLMDAN
jgi:hypothetical protein